MSVIITKMIQIFDCVFKLFFTCNSSHVHVEWYILMLYTLHVCLYGWAGAGGLGPLGQAGVGVAYCHGEIDKVLPTLQSALHAYTSTPVPLCTYTLVDKTYNL